MAENATVIDGALNMRAAKDKGSGRITLIPKGSLVAVTERGEEWSRAVYNQYEGYVLTRYLHFESESDDTDKITICLSKDNAIALYEALKLSLNK